MDGQQQRRGSTQRPRSLPFQQFASSQSNQWNTHPNSNRFSITATYNLWNTTPIHSQLDEGLSNDVIQEREQDLIRELDLNEVETSLLSSTNLVKRTNNNNNNSNNSNSYQQNSNNTSRNTRLNSSQQQQQEPSTTQNKRSSASSIYNNVNVRSHDHYLQRFVNNNPNSKKTNRFRTLYLQWCEELGCAPTQELIRSLKNTIRQQVPFQRLSICHAGVDDAHVKAIVNTMLLNSVNGGGNNANNGNGAENDTFDVNEILLNHNEITDEGCVMLCDHILTKPLLNSKITSVELFGNKLTDVSCESLSLMLRTNTFLKRLKLGDNLIGPSGAAKLAEGLKHNSNLTQLHLGGNKIDADGLRAISDALMENVTLTSLGLRDNEVGPEGIKFLAETLAQETCALSDIQLKGNRIAAQGAVYLSSVLHLNKSLKVLELQSNMIGPGVKSLCQSLIKNQSVHALNFNDNDLADDGSESVAQLLQENPSITTLGLANNRIRKKGASSLAKALEVTQTAITGLDLGNNEIGNGGAVALAKSLKSNKVLTSLDLRSCEIHLKGILALAEMAAVNTTLRHLDLGANYAKNHGAIAWANVLSTNKSLTRLCLTDNQIYHEGGEALATGLQTNFTLRNFSYGGQGASANRIDSTIRRIIDSIVAENKRHWESITSNNGNGENDEPTEDTLDGAPYESSNQYRFVSVSKMLGGLYTPSNRQQQQQLTTPPPIVTSKTTQGVKNTSGRNSLPVNAVQNLQIAGNRNSLNVNRRGSSSFAPNILHQSTANLPNWFTSSVQLSRSQQMDPVLLDSRLEFLFKNNLLKAENPKFPGCYFIGNVINTLRKVFTDIRIDEIGLVQFAYNNPKYYVHLSREMVKTQIKYLADPQDMSGIPPQSPQMESYEQDPSAQVSSLQQGNNRRSVTNSGEYSNLQFAMANNRMSGDYGYFNGGASVVDNNTPPSPAQSFNGYLAVSPNTPLGNNAGGVHSNTLSGDWPHQQPMRSRGSGDWSNIRGNDDFAMGTMNSMAMGNNMNMASVPMNNHLQRMSGDAYQQQQQQQQQQMIADHWRSGSGDYSSNYVNRTSGDWAAQNMQRESGEWGGGWPAQNIQRTSGDYSNFSNAYPHNRMSGDYSNMNIRRSSTSSDSSTSLTRQSGDYSNFQTRMSGDWSQPMAGMRASADWRGSGDWTAHLNNVRRSGDYSSSPRLGSPRMSSPRLSEAAVPFHPSVVNPQVTYQQQQQQQQQQQINNNDSWYNPHLRYQ